MATNTNNGSSSAANVTTVIRTGMPKPPPDFVLIEPALIEFEKQMRAEVTATFPASGRRKEESPWGVHRVNTARTRHVYELKKRGEVTAAVWEYLCDNCLIDGALADAWEKKSGYYTSLCCVECVNKDNFTHGGVCVCRTRSATRGGEEKDDGDDAKPIVCDTCGCTGCATSAPKKQKQKKADEQRSMELE